jgi:Protein of unknown function (DUF2384)
MTLSSEIRLARVAAQAQNVFESADPAMIWLKRPNRALGGHAPIDLLDTDAGTERVVELLDSPIRRRFANELSMGFTVERMLASVSVELTTAVEISYLPLFRLPVSWVRHLCL